MKQTAEFRRNGYFLYILPCVLVLASCAGSIRPDRAQDEAPSEMAQQDPAIATGQYAEADIATTTEQAAGTQVAGINEASSRILSSTDSEAIGLELLDGDRQNQLVISSSSKASDVSVNRLSSPDRLVIDIKGINAGTQSRTFDTSDAELLNKIRVGSHPDKSRVVLDLVEGRNIEHEINANDGRIVVNLREAGPDVPQMIESSSQHADLAVSPAPLLPETSGDAVLVRDEESASIGEEQSDMAAPKLDQLTQNEDQKSVLNALSIEQVGADSNLLVLDMSSPGSYNLEKTAPSEYVLTLKSTDLGPNVSSLVAPPKSGLIRSVRPLSKDGNVSLRIFAQQGAVLNARVGDNKLVVSASSNGTSVEDMRAQAAPEKADDAPAAKPAGNEVVKVSDEGPSSEGDLLEKSLDELAGNNYTGKLISLDLQDTDIDNALRIIAEVSSLNIIASDDVTGKVTLRLIDVPWDQALDVILKTNGLDKVREGNVIRIAPIEKLRQEREALKQIKIAQEELEPLQVKYIRISYAKASEIKPLVETVVSERGVVTYDERTNQIIVKDIPGGLRNVMELVSKIDLRTPQVLLETQIVEANRNLIRELGAEMGFQFIQSPETGNATGNNFPNSINFGGSAIPGDPNNVGSSFPVAIGEEGGSAISLLLGSADGTKNLAFRISALEQEGRARVVSRPSVATTNNKQAVIKSVEKIRVKTPDGGLSVATGQGASAGGSSAVATEQIEVGITLEVTPQASPDYYVLLDIDAKSSTFGSIEVDGIPSEIERSATSTILVSSGQTFAMGGIYKIQERDSITGVPFLKDVPVIGHLFRRSAVNDTDEELLFFITPRIVEGSFDDATMKVSS